MRYVWALFPKNFFCEVYPLRRLGEDWKSLSDALHVCDLARHINYLDKLVSFIRTVLPTWIVRAQGHPLSNPGRAWGNDNGHLLFGESRQLVFFLREMQSDVKS